MREKMFLLGATENKELVFCEFGVIQRNGHFEFSASFYTVMPFSNFDMEEYFEDYIESVEKTYLYDWCVKFDCRPSELAECLADECNDPRDALDCSLYTECYKVDGNYWYFESVFGGQHDTRDEIEEVINFKVYNLINELWDNYHLKEVDNEIVKQVEELQNTLSKVDEKTWIVDYIKRHQDELV